MNVFCGIFAIASVLFALTSAEDFICPDETQSMYPHPTRCAKFLECNKGILVEHDCISGTLWNSELGFCDLADNVDCEDIEDFESEENGDIDGSGSGDESGPVGECPLINGEFVDFLTHSHDCTIYYMCDWGVPIEMVCPDDLHFNPTLNVCDYPWEAGCINRLRD